MTTIEKLFGERVIDKAPLVPGTFDYAYDRIRNIKGWLGKTDARCLFEYARKTPEDGLIVEVGTYRGRSAALFAEAGRNVLTIDPLIAQEDADALADILEDYPGVTWQRSASTDAGLPPSIDLLFIDGDHKGDAPLNDCKHFLPAMKPGAWVLFHDYGSEEGVDVAVSKLEAERVIKRVEVIGGVYVGVVL